MRRPPRCAPGRRSPARSRRQSQGGRSPEEAAGGPPGAFSHGDTRPLHRGRLYDQARGAQRPVSRRGFAGPGFHTRAGGGLHARPERPSAPALEAATPILTRPPARPPATSPPATRPHLPGAAAVSRSRPPAAPSRSRRRAHSWPARGPSASPPAARCPAHGPAARAAPRRGSARPPPAVARAAGPPRGRAHRRPCRPRAGRDLEDSVAPAPLKRRPPRRPGRRADDAAPTPHSPRTDAPPPWAAPCTQRDRGSETRA